MITSDYYNYKVLREVVNQNFTFADLSNRFKGVDSSTGNIFCPFHENHETPAAKMYWDDDRGIWVLHCFGQCHRSFTTYDYVEQILCEKYGKYNSPLHFLKVNMPEATLSMQLSFAKSYVDLEMEQVFDKKKDYINNVFDETGNILDFIEKLYTA